MENIENGQHIFFNNGDFPSINNQTSQMNLNEEETNYIPYINNDTITCNNKLRENSILNKENNILNQSQITKIDILNEVLILQSRNNFNYKLLNNPSSVLNNFQLYQIDKKKDIVNIQPLPLVSTKLFLSKEFYIKYIQIFDQVFSNENDSTTFDKIQFIKYLYTLNFIPYHSNNTSSYQNESLFRCFQMVYSNHLLETKINTYINNNLSLTNLSNNKSNNNESFNINERKWLIIDKAHLNEFKSELMALFCNSAIPLEVISYNSYYEYFFEKLSQLISTLDCADMKENSFSLKTIRAPFGKRIYTNIIEKVNNNYDIKKMVLLFNCIYEQFRIFKNGLVIQSFYFEFNINEEEILMKCFRQKKGTSKIKICYKAYNDRFYQLNVLTQCIILTKGYIVKDNGKEYLCSFFNIKGNRGFICKTKKSSVYMYTIGITETNKFICIDPDKQNDDFKEKVNDFIIKSKESCFSERDMSMYSVFVEKLCIIDFNDLADEIYFIFEFKSIDDYKNLIQGIKLFNNQRPYKSFELKEISSTRKKSVKDKEVMTNTSILINTMNQYIINQKKNDN